MTEQEERDMARRLVDDVNALSFEKALELVRFKPAKVEEILRMSEEHKRWQEEFARTRERMRQAALELR